MLQLKNQMMEKSRQLRKSTARLIVNELPTRAINSGYDIYSRIYKGQLSLGLPVAPELIVSREEIKSNAVGKLALSLSHMLPKITGHAIEREKIKSILFDELEMDRIRLMEKVILLSRDELRHICTVLLKIDDRFFRKIYNEAFKRNLLQESLKYHRQPAYFESEVDEKEQNGRGDYEIVYYQDFTGEGKEIKFRRLLSMEGVTSGDSKPSLVLVPGFANNSSCFDLSSRYSMAREFADDGKWVYLFDPRGVGVNGGRFDPDYTVDTLSDYDLPTVLNFITRRSCGKPSILIGHSMGGLVSENMVLNWAMRLDFDKVKLPCSRKRALDKILVSDEEAQASLKSVRAVISLGSPKSFDRTSHIFYPVSLWLNHLARIFRFSKIPIQELSRVVTQIPVLKSVSRYVYNKDIGGLNFLICPENHKNDKHLIEKYFERATESIPLGLGFQFLKSVYDGQGFKRMDPSALNYTQHYSFFPKNIPVFHIWGARDCLAPLHNLRYSQYYPHKIKQIIRLERPEDLEKVEILSEKSQLIDFIIEGANHLDLLYGKQADAIVKPLLNRIIEAAWSDWSYQEMAQENPDTAECVAELPAI